MLTNNRQILFNCWMPPDLHQRLKTTAEQQDMKMSHIIRKSTTHYLDFIDDEMEQVEKLKSQIRQKRDEADTFFGGIFTNA